MWLPPTIRISRVYILVLFGVAIAQPDPCTFVPGKGVGDVDFLLAGDFTGVELQCARAVLLEHPEANGARLHRSMCSAVYDMRHIENDPLEEQRTCYVYPSSIAKDVCAAAPAACQGTYDYDALSFAHSALTGAVPTQLGMLSATLEHLDLAANAVSGTIPTQIGRLTRLRTLKLDSNHLSGSLPSQLGQLTNVHHLDVHGNALSGAIPLELGKINPAYCQLVASQTLDTTHVVAAPVPPSSSPASSSSSAVEDDEDEEPGSLGEGLLHEEDKDNRFGCPMPPLPAACGRHGVVYDGRDAHRTGRCEYMAGVAYGAIRDTLGA